MLRNLKKTFCFYVVATIQDCFVAIQVPSLHHSRSLDAWVVLHGLEQQQFYVSAGGISYIPRRLAKSDNIIGVYFEV
jgi:hypothetical protein